jgi:hypothetical protein
MQVRGTEEQLEEGSSTRSTGCGESSNADRSGHESRTPESITFLERLDLVRRERERRRERYGRRRRPPVPVDDA